MQEEIKILKEKVKVLEEKLQLATMPFEIKEIIRGEVIKDIDTLTASTRQQTIALPDLPVTLTLPVNPTGFLVLKATSGREYKVFYV